VVRERRQRIRLFMIGPMKAGKGGEAGGSDGLMVGFSIP
jgi:hypothetical protein